MKPVKDQLIPEEVTRVFNLHHDAVPAGFMAANHLITVFSIDMENGNMVRRRIYRELGIIQGLTYV